MTEATKISNISVEQATRSICDVWTDNLEKVMADLRELITKFPYISMV